MSIVTVLDTTRKNSQAREMALQRRQVIGTRPNERSQFLNTALRLTQATNLRPNAIKIDEIVIDQAINAFAAIKNNSLRQMQHSLLFWWMRRRSTRHRSTSRWLSCVSFLVVDGNSLHSPWSRKEEVFLLHDISLLRCLSTDRPPSSSRLAEWSKATKTGTTLINLEYRARDGATVRGAMLWLTWLDGQLNLFTREFRKKWMPKPGQSVPPSCQSVTQVTRRDWISLNGMETPGIVPMSRGYCKPLSAR